MNKKERGKLTHFLGAEEARGSSPGSGELY